MREDTIASSIQYSVLRSGDKQPSFLARIPRYLYLYWLAFACVRDDTFKDLRNTWGIQADDYLASFGAASREAARKNKAALKGLGDMGYSGSTFFKTADGAYLVKSVPRRFEHTFFQNDMLLPYAEFMQANPMSLLVRITDFLENVQFSIGSILGLVPSHHLIMENLLYGQDTAAENEGNEANKWASWDLKPMSYFYPERDIAGGVLSSEATKSKLADDFDEKIYLSLDQAESFKSQLEKDTKLLETCNAVDYSLFLVRIPAADNQSGDQQSDHFISNDPSASPASASQPTTGRTEQPSWRSGIPSARDNQGKRYLYRASILDFFWAKHKVHAQAMTGLINAYNIFDRKGPMSVTTTAPEYRERFLKMCTEIVEVREE